MATPILLPALSHFLNNNGWLGSAGLLRFQIEKPQDGEMTAVLWQGPFSRPYAQEIERQAFPVSAEGLAAVTEYLNTKAAQIEARPPFTPEETTAFYQAKKAEEAAAKEEAPKSE